MTTTCFIHTTADPCLGYIFWQGWRSLSASAASIYFLPFISNFLKICLPPRRKTRLASTSIMTVIGQASNSAKLLKDTRLREIDLKFSICWGNSFPYAERWRRYIRRCLFLGPPPRGDFESSAKKPSLRSNCSWPRSTLGRTLAAAQDSYAGKVLRHSLNEQRGLARCIMDPAISVCLSATSVSRSVREALNQTQASRLYYIFNPCNPS